MKNEKKLSIFFIVLITLSLTACSNRDLTNVRTSLYGHWVDNDDTDYYFKDDGITTVSKDGETTKYEYKVVEHDEVKNNIILDLTNIETGGGYSTEYIFKNKDRTNIKAITNHNSFKVPSSNDQDEISNLVEDIMEDFIEDQEGKFTENELEYLDSDKEPKDK